MLDSFWVIIIFEQDVPQCFLKVIGGPRVSCRNEAIPDIWTGTYIQRRPPPQFCSCESDVYQIFEEKPFLLRIETSCTRIELVDRLSYAPHQNRRVVAESG